MSTEEAPGITADHSSSAADGMRDLLSEFGDELEFLWEEDGSLSARRRSGGEHRSTGPVLVRAESVPAMQSLLTHRSHAAWCSCSAGKTSLGHTADIARPKLHASGLDLRRVLFGGQVIELIVVNPGHPSRGRVVVDRNGIVKWDHWCPAQDDVTGNRLVSVIIETLGTNRVQAVVPAVPPSSAGRPHP